MATRPVYNSLSTPPVTGPNYMDQIAEKIGILFDAVSLKQVTVTNSVNDYTLTVDPVLNADVGEGMSFFIKPNATNTGAVRLRVTSANPYYDVKRSNGNALTSSQWNTSTWYFVSFLGGAFNILSEIASSQVTSIAIFEQFDNSGTWTKPAGLNANAIVVVEAWGGGGGGGRAGSVSLGSGAGGGAYLRKEFKAGDLTSTVSITVGAAGAGAAVDNTSGTAGGNSSFGGYLTAYGGGGGGTTGGGGGGGSKSAGATGTGSGNTSAGGGPILIRTGTFASGSPAINYGGDYIYNGTVGISNGSIFGGGAGASNLGGSSPAGDSVYGGGGGASNNLSAGTSVYGGAGGAFGVVGSVPGGGGGGTVAGGKGRVIVRVIP